MKIQYFVLAATLFIVSLPSVSGEMLTGNQIKKLFSDKTYDIKKMDANSIKLSAYSSSDGKRIVSIPRKNERSKRRWWVERNKLCFNHPKRNDYCREIMAVGDGVYHLFKNGKHVSTFSNFRDGNQL